MNNNYTEEVFESIKHINEYGQEFWYAREFQKVLEYTEWRKFYGVIEKAKTACSQSTNNANDHFVDVDKIVHLGVADRKIQDIVLSRYACYLIVMNGDSRKLIDNYENLTDDQKRLAIRKEMAEHNKQLVAAAKDAGVETSLDYAVFQNYGYQGLYGGLKASDIHKRKGLKKSQQILDHMGYEELAANLFRATQTEAKLRRENIQGKKNANQTHFEVGKKVRDTIKDLGGTMPEDLPTPDKSIKQIEKEQKKLENKQKR